MKNFFYQALKSVSSDIRIGAFHALGAEPLRQSSKGLEMGFFGRKLTFRRGEMLPKIERDYQMNILGSGFAAMGLLQTVGIATGGYSEGGVIGAARGLLWDFGVNASIVKHAYQRIGDKSGVVTFAPGMLGNNRMLRRLGAPGKAASVALGFGDVTMRYLWGSALAGTVGNALGGGFLGTIGAMAGGSLGVRYAGRLTMGMGMYYGAKAVGYGTYNVLKAGYNHTQMQKSIHTSGDMAAFMTQGAFTMRARAVMAMQKSHMNARSALGQEANYMHMPQRNYMSNYRQGY